MSGISIDAIFLLASVAQVGDLEKGQREYDLRLVNLRQEISPDKKQFMLFAGFDVMFGIENPMFKFSCDYLVRYSRPDGDWDWKEFKTSHALAHILPYLREYVSNVTTRMPIPVLILNPVNTETLVSDFHARQAAKPVPLQATPPKATGQ